MLEVLLVSLFFMLGMSGWGNLVYRFLFSQKPLFPASILFGMIVSSHLALTLHFFTPLFSALTAGIVFVGLVLFVRQFLQLPQPSLPLRIYLFSAGLFILIAGYAFDSNLYSDVLAYHFPTLAWIRNNKIVFGLANLDERLGFNSIWHMTSSLSNPALRWQSSMDYASIVFLWVYLINVFYLPKKLRLLGWICRGVALLIWGKATFLINLGLPATDLPSTLCCLLFYEKILTVFDQEKMDQKDFFELFFIYLFAVQLKLSQIFLIFPFFALIFSFRENLRNWLSEKKLKYALVTFLLTFPWLIRSFFLSGCWFFPLAQSCFPHSSWGLPLADVAFVKFEVLTWAKVQNSAIDPDQFLQWFPAWAQQQFSKLHIQILVLSLVFACSIKLFRKMKNFKNPILAHDFVRTPKWFYSSIFLVLILWFSQGPDPRFAMGSFIFIQGLVFYWLCLEFKDIKKYKTYLFGILVIALGLYLQDISRIFLNATRKSLVWSDRLTEADRLSYIDKVNSHQVAYKVPDFTKDSEGGCWLDETFCANLERPDLVQSKLGSYLLFKNAFNKIQSH